jgi:hypothetical protein
MTAFLNVRLPEKWIVRDYNLATSFSWPDALHFLFWGVH